ncbi:uncharacterized protein ACNS7B_003255 [Menidia menidia]
MASTFARPQTTAKENGLDQERANRNENANASRKVNQDEGRVTKDKEVKYEKEKTVFLELEGGVGLSPMMLLKATKEVCGTVLACRMVTKDKFEMTVVSQAAKERLLDGFRVGETRVHGRDINTDELMVSFMGLPAYIQDEEILLKLLSWGVSAVSEVRRRMWPGTTVADGTRFVKVRCPGALRAGVYGAQGA